MKKVSNKMDYLIYSLFGIILITIVSIIYIVYAQNIFSKESIDEANQYIIIYTDHTHNTPIVQIDIGDDGSHIYIENVKEQQIRMVI